MLNIAYLAGIFDGEGSIARGRGRNGVLWSLMVTNAERPILEAFQRAFGGQVRQRSKKRDPHAVRPIFEWGITGKNMRRCLTALFPFLRRERNRVNASIVLSVDEERCINGRLRKS